MKTFKMLLVVLASVISFSTFSNTNDETSELNTTIQKEIKSHLNVKAGQSEKVEVVFTTDECGKVNLAIARTSNIELKQALENSFMKLQFSNLKPENAYSVTLSLKLV